MSLEFVTVAQHYLIIVQLCLNDSSRNYTWDCGMDFVSYSHLIFLISGQTFEFTVVLEKVWDLRPYSLHHPSTQRIMSWLFGTCWYHGAEQ